jgi:hypothetical protein
MFSMESFGKLLRQSSKGVGAKGNLT